MNVIPHISNQPFFTELVTLDRVSYKLKFTWNHRCEFWSLDVLDSADNILIAGVKIVLDFDILRRYSKTELPHGVLLAIREGLGLDNLKFDELGNNANIIYITEAEYESI